ncbi:MAG: WD40/YVTN/BNR-like repeat-containing protein [Streptosporangiaceae bacterium]
MASAAAGWALVWSSDPAGSGNPVLEAARTSDGGKTWSVVTPPSARALPQGQVVLDSVSAQQAWLAAGAGNSDNPSVGTTTVYGTSDGGLHWSAGTPIAGSAPSLLDFAGPDRGWLLEDLGAAMQQEAATLWRTTNGGMTWSLAAKTPPLAQPPSIASALPASCDKTGLAFASAQVGWITSVCNSLPGAILVTTDGGAHWATQPVPLPMLDCPSGCDVQPPLFAGPTTFLQIDAYPSAAYLLVSDDSGGAWTVRRLPAGAGAYPRVAFFGPADGVAVSAESQGVIGPDFYLTRDGGLSWTAVVQGRHFGTSGASFDFVSPQLGFTWIAGEQQLYRTADAGRTWTAVVPQLG